MTNNKPDYLHSDMWCNEHDIRKSWEVDKKPSLKTLYCTKCKEEKNGRTITEPDKNT